MRWKEEILSKRVSQKEEDIEKEIDKVRKNAGDNKIGSQVKRKRRKLQNYKMTKIIINIASPLTPSLSLLLLAALLLLCSAGGITLRTRRLRTFCMP